MGDHFYITLPQSASLDLFPNNILAGYTTQICTPIDLRNGDYEVALCECILNGNVYNVLKSMMVMELSKPVEDGEDYEDIYLPRGYYTNIDDIINAINNQLQKSKLGPGMYLTYIHEGKSELPFEYDEKVYTLVRIVHANNYDILKRKEPKNILVKPNFISTINENSRPMLTYGTRSNLWFAVDFKSFVISSLTAYVYTDIIEYQYVGNVQAQLLRAIQLPIQFNTRMDDHVIEIKQPHYIRVLKQEITRIRMHLNTVEGDKVAFTSGHLDLKLHFRRRRE